MNDFEAWLEGHEPSLASARKIWAYLGSLPPAQVEGLSGTPLAKRIKASWESCLIRAEHESALALDGQGSTLSLEDYGDLQQDFLAISRVAETKRTFAFVGCGPFPETLAFAHSFLGESWSLTGIDWCEAAIQRAAYVHPSAAYVCKHAVDVDYSHYDAVMLAIALREKQRVMLKVAEDLPNGGLLCVRLPEGAKRIIYEDCELQLLSGLLKPVVVGRPSVFSRTEVWRKS